MNQEHFTTNIQKNIKEIIFRDSIIPIEDFIHFYQMEKNNKFKHFFNIAKNLSFTSEYERFRLGALITIQGKIIAKGVNSSKTHPVQRKFNNNRDEAAEFTTHPTHAEIAALNKAKNIDLKKAQMFIYHIGPNDKPKLARPCPACMDAIRTSGIKTIHYSTPHGFASEFIKDDMQVVKKTKKHSC